jgi:hypothetical protein
MKGKYRTATLIKFPIVALVLCFVPWSSNAQTPTELKPAISALGYFIGDWECSGKFDSSGKVIDAHQRFAPELDGSWILFRHDDKPPFNYHALSEWGWDQANKQFVMTVQDSFGGIRIFRSSGWSSAQLQWDGDDLGSTSPPAQRFTFERLDERHFRVSYFTLKNGDWSRMDSSTCSKQ